MYLYSSLMKQWIYWGNSQERGWLGSSFIYRTPTQHECLSQALPAQSEGSLLKSPYGAVDLVTFCASPALQVSFRRCSPPCRAPSPSIIITTGTQVFRHVSLRGTVHSHTTASYPWPELTAWFKMLIVQLQKSPKSLIVSTLFQSPAFRSALPRKSDPPYLQAPK